MKIAVVTGASSGMGREFVLQLEQYITVDEIWVIARRGERLCELQGEVGAKIRPISLDLTESESFTKYSTILLQFYYSETGDNRPFFW